MKGFAYEIVEEPLREWTDWMRAWSEDSNERARVPVLRYVDGEGIEFIMPESNEINFFLDRIDGNPTYTPAEGSEAYQEMLRWWRWCDHELKPMIDLYKYGEHRVWNKEVALIHQEALSTYLSKLEAHLSSRRYLVEDRLTLADIAVIPFIRQIMRTREGAFDFAPFPHIVSWAHTILEAPWFVTEVMKKYPLGGKT